MDDIWNDYDAFMYKTHLPTSAFNDNIPQYRMHNDDKCATQKFSYQNNVCIFA